MNNTNKHIFFIDKNRNNVEIFCSTLEKYGYVCYSADNYEMIDEYLDTKPQIDIVLMDITGFDLNIWDRCKKIHSLGIPLLILSARPNLRLQQDSIKYGASAIIEKPVILKDFIKLINSIIDNE